MGIPNFGGLGVTGSRVAAIKSPHTTSQCLSIQSFALSVVIWLPFQCQVMPPGLGGRGRGQTPRGSKMVSFEMPSPYSHTTSNHTIGSSCTVWSRYNIQRGRQTDRTIGISHPCYSIGSLKIAPRLTLMYRSTA